MNTADDNSIASPRRSWRRTLVRIVVILGVGYAVYMGIGRFFGRVIIYPGASMISLQRIVDPAAERLVRLDGGVELEAWLYAARSESMNPAPLVVLLHGNGELIDHLVSAVEWYRSRGFTVLLPEYRGYGDTGGHPSERAIVSDCLAWIDVVKDRIEVDERVIVYHGFSLGGGVACSLTRERAPSALVLSSTFRSLGAMYRSFGLPGFVAPDTYDNIGAIRGFAGPVLVTHGRADDIIPYREGVALAEVREGVRFSAHPGGHNDAFEQSEHWGAVELFLREIQVVSR